MLTPKMLPAAFLMALWCGSAFGAPTSKLVKDEE
jgi:hypothetical protein